MRTPTPSDSESGEYYQVKQGDNLDLIAVRFGFKDHTDIYNHPENADFKAQRSDPDTLFPGDRVFIPNRVKQQPCATDQHWTFVLRLPKKVLRITVEDFEGKAVADTPYRLVVESTGSVMGRLLATQRQTFEGNTNAAGLLEQPVPLNARRGTLTVGSFVRDLAVGELNPPEETADNGISGIQARLANLGFDPGPVDGAWGPQTEAAVRAFQAEHPALTVDGICGPDTLDKLKSEHKI
jgi:N-acetylmuramoyl-L-alanine amidase